MDIEEYVRSRGGPLLRFALLVCGDRSTAEEVVQDVLCDVLPRWDRLDQVEDMDSYLRRAVVNRRNSWWRRRRPIPTADPPQTNVASHADRIGVEVTVWDACRRLPVRQRAAVVLRYYEELTYEEIADILDCPLGTAKSLVNRGVARLRPLVGDSRDEREVHP